MPPPPHYAGIKIMPPPPPRDMWGLGGLVGDLHRSVPPGGGAFAQIGAPGLDVGNSAVYVLCARVL
jgi:hypothetical protein